MFGEVARGFFLAGGAAEGYSPLNAFDAALIQAGIGDFNIVKVSSIIPPGCREIQPRGCPHGSIVPAAYAFIISDIPGELVSAAVAAAVPEQERDAGLIMEYSARGHKEEAEEIVRNMAMEGMRIRGRGIEEIRSIAIEYKVQTVGAAVAAVVLWPYHEEMDD